MVTGARKPVSFLQLTGCGQLGRSVHIVVTFFFGLGEVALGSICRSNHVTNVSGATQIPGKVPRLAS